MKGWLALSVAVALASCDDTPVHIYSGQLYEPGRACLDPSTGIDVIAGGSTGDSCAAACLVTPPGSTTQSVYISTVCPPYPSGLNAEQADAAADPNDPCTGAFAAYQSGTLCGPGDGGVDATGDGASDAGPDAPTDAPTDAATTD